jgi:DNA-binding IclR family transcriptional regulator
MLAFLPAGERRALYAGPLDRFTDRTLTGPGEVEEECARIRAQGYACSRGQRIVGAVGLAAPVFDAAGAVFGDVCLTVPEARFDEALEPRYGGLLVAAAAEVSADLRSAQFLRDS